MIGRLVAFLFLCFAALVVTGLSVSPGDGPSVRDRIRRGQRNWTIEVRSGYDGAVIDYVMADDGRGFTYDEAQDQMRELSWSTAFDPENPTVRRPVYAVVYLDAVTRDAVRSVQ